MIITQFDTFLNEGRKPLKWTFEKCKEVASKCKTMGEFYDNYGSAYNSAISHGWLDEISSHLTQNKKPSGFWKNKNNCKKAALECKTRKEFSLKYSSAYTNSRQNGWLDEICSHMETIGNLVKRIVYAYEFPDNCVYVGLTFNINRRNLRHLTMNDNNTSAVWRHMIKTGLKPTLCKLTEKYIDVKEAQELENYYVNSYRNNGWNVLNRIKTGGIGGNITKWTKEKCHEKALKYKTRGEFNKNDSSAYQAAQKYGWMDEICSHMIRERHKKWTKEKCHEKALKYDTRSEFQDSEAGAYTSARINGWLDEICSHMTSSQKQSGHWLNKENCREESSKYKGRKEFNDKCGSAYNVATKMKWLDEFFPKK